MNEKLTRDFIKRSKAYAKRNKLSLTALSKKLFNKNPYALERLEEALDEGGAGGGPSHVHVLNAMQLLDDLEEEKERALA